MREISINFLLDFRMKLKDIENTPGKQVGSENRKVGRLVVFCGLIA